MNKILKFLISLLFLNLFTCQKSLIPRLPVLAGKGYNILKGNPLTESKDPGFENQIFLLSYTKGLTTDKGNYLIPDGTQATEESYCGLKSESEEIIGEESYQESLRQSVDVSGGYNGPFLSVSFTASLDYSKAQQEMSKEKRVVYLSKGECLEQTLAFPRFRTLPLSDDFIAGVMMANDGITTWENFIEQYGTHYVSKVTLGGRMIISTSFSQKDCEFLKSNQLDIGIGLSVSYGGYSGDIKSKTEIKNKYEKATSNMNIKRSYIYTGGETNSENNWDKWTKTLEDNLAPIKYSLVDISELFTSTNFPNLSSSQIKNMKNQFNNSTLSLCKKYNLSPPKPDSPLPITTAKFVNTEAIGCRSGDLFIFDKRGIFPYTKLKSVRVCSGRFIYMIQFNVIDVFGNVKKLSPHGTEKGNCTEWNVNEESSKIDGKEKEEYINTANVYLWYTGKGTEKTCVVSGLEFSTNKQRTVFWGDKKDTEQEFVNIPGQLIGTFGQGGYEIKNGETAIGKLGFVSLFKYLGCYEDKEASRDLEGFKGENMDGKIETCISMCKEKFFTYAGLQNRNECHCDNSFGKYQKLNDDSCAGKLKNAIYLVE